MSFSDKDNINILTSLLKANEICDAVVCPGSRNAPIIHNLHEAGFNCIPVTDERCAGFYAIGISEALSEKTGTPTPVSLCLTSGSALLNCAPAVAEAYHRHIPLLVISADRPERQIGQLQGQTLVQPGAFGPSVKKCVALPEPHDSASRLYCNRLVNDAIDALSTRPYAPVQINVPVSEPLFGFTTPELPEERSIQRLAVPYTKAESYARIIAEKIKSAKCPMIVMGQCPDSQILATAVGELRRRIATVGEPLCPGFTGCDLDGALRVFSREPDFVLYCGDTVVSKNLKKYLRESNHETWLATADGEIHDVDGHLTRVVDCDIAPLLSALANLLPPPGPAALAWEECVSLTMPGAPEEYSEAMAVNLLETALAGRSHAVVHYANSTAVRLADLYATGYCHVNRGVNGIEGSISAAAGFSLANTRRPTYCVTGDLSFFYDSNGLWCERLDGRLRIMLLNNGGGAIFDGLKGLSASGAYSPYVNGAHSADAEGICSAYEAEYLRAIDRESLRRGIACLTCHCGEKPAVLECVFAHQQKK